MKTSSFEVDFLNALSSHIEKAHPELEVLRASRTNRLFEAFVDHSVSHYTPDLIVRNPGTGRMLVVEVKGGRSLNSVPFASISRLKHFALSAPAQIVRVQLVSSAKVPPSLKSILDESRIGVTSTESPETAVRDMETLLLDLELAPDPN